MNAMLSVSGVNLEKSKVQSEAVKATIAGFKKASRGKVIMACGTGKTRVAFGVLSARKDAVSIICVPSLGLVSQFLKDCPSLAVAHSVLPVCSRMNGESPEDYNIAQATTSPAEISERIKQATKKKPLLIISTYQSYLKVAEAAKICGKSPTLLIADEAHNTAGPEGKAMSHCLHDCHLHVAKRLFLTATPRDYTGKKDAASMHKSELYGEEFYAFSFGAAMSRGIVCDYEIRLIDVLSESLLKKIRKAQKVSELSEAVAVHLVDELKKEERGRCFVFHTRLERSQEFASFLKSRGIHAACISGKDPVRKREKMLREFEQHDGSSVICSVRVFGEGIDAPSVNRIVIADPMTSPVQIAQIIGRGTRVEPGKEKLIITLPVFLSPDEQFDSERLSNFGLMLSVLNTLRSSYKPMIHEDLSGDPVPTGRRRVVSDDPIWSRVLTNIPEGVFRERVVGRVIYREWTDDLIRKRVDEWIQENGSPFVVGKARVGGVQSIACYLRTRGKTFAEWLRENGYETKSNPRKWTDEEIKKHVDNWVNETGSCAGITQGDGFRSIRAYLSNHRGTTLRKWLLLNGYMPSNRWTDEEILKEVKLHLSRGGGVPSPSTSDVFRRINSALHKQNNSLRNWLVQNGFYVSDVHQKRKWNKESIMKFIDDFIKNHGRQPFVEESKEATSIDRWLKRHEGITLPAWISKTYKHSRKVGGWKDDQIIMHVDEFIKHHGYSPSSTSGVFNRIDSWLRKSGDSFSCWLMRNGYEQPPRSPRRHALMMIDEDVFVFEVKKAIREFFKINKRAPKYTDRGYCPLNIKSWNIVDGLLKSRNLGTLSSFKKTHFPNGIPGD